jgi:nickel/cobalt exporter
MRRPASLLVLCGTVAVLLLWPAAAHAHPLGNFTVNVYGGLQLRPDEVRLVHVVDMAEIPTFQQLRRLDSDAWPEPAELSDWANRAARETLQRLSIAVNGRPVALRLENVSVGLRPGQAGLRTLRLEAVYLGPLPSEGTLRFRDGSFPGRAGWREVTAVGTDGSAVRRSSVPARSVSDELRSYPEELLSSPVRVTWASVVFERGPSAPTGTAAGTGGAQGEAPPGVSSGAFAALAARGPASPAAAVLSLVLALGFGALHSLGPGHGKTVMAAYLLGHEARFRHVLAVAAAVAAMHTASVLALGILLLIAGRAFPAESLYPWLGLVSGAAALALGAGLLVSRLAGQAGDHPQHPNTRAPSHRPLSARGLAALALSGGLLPSPTAIVVLLASIALGRVAFGLALVGAFSLGLAAALAFIGALAVKAGTFFVPRVGRWARLAPLGSASAIAAMGVILVARAALQF